MNLFLKFLAFRLFNAVLFIDDQQLFIVRYQYFEESLYGPEIGYNKIYDYGKLPMESNIYQEQSLSLFSNIYFIYYGILKYFGFDFQYFTAYGPRIIQCFLTAISDCYLIKIGMILGVQKFPLILINLCTWFNCQCATMSLKKSIIQNLYLLALYYWVSYKYKNRKCDSIISRCISIIIGTVSFICIIPWIIEWIQELREKKKMSLIILNLYSILALIIFILINDNYGQIYIKILHFIVQIEININLIQMIFLLPYVLLGWIVFFIVGLYVQYKLKNRSILHIMIYYLIAMVLLKNVDEFDILPIFQFIVLICALGMQQMKKHKYNNILVFIGVFSNINMFLLHNTYQNQDGITVIQHIASNNNINGVLFLTNCHQTPYYTFINKNITINYPMCDLEIDDSFYFVLNRMEKYQSDVIILHNIYVNHDVDEYLKENNYYYVIYTQYYQDYFYQIGQFKKLKFDYI